MRLGTAIVDILADATRIAPTPGPGEHVTVNKMFNGCRHEGLQKRP